MRVSVNIASDNAAATIENGGGEDAARMLEAVAERCRVGGIVSGPLHDLNGNRVGEYSFEISRETEEDV